MHKRCRPLIVGPENRSVKQLDALVECTGWRSTLSVISPGLSVSVDFAACRLMLPLLRSAGLIWCAPMARPTQSELRKAMEGIVGAADVSHTAPDLVAYSTDMWPKAQLWKRQGDVMRFPPDCVVWPKDEEEVRRIVVYCVEREVPVIPYGGGSGVCGGAIPVRGGVSVDMKRLRHIDVDRASQTVSVGAGVNGQLLEDELNRHGFTLGHFPSSIMCSTAGGWLAARSAGQFSSRYGKIEDMVLGLRVVIASGDVLDTAQRGAGEPDWTQAIVGSEGTLGVIVSATLRVHPLPAHSWYRGYKFPDLSDGFDAMRLLMQAGLKPCALRLYDPFDSIMALGKKKQAKVPSTQATPSSALQRAISRVKASARNAALSRAGLLNSVVTSIPSQCLLIVGFEGPEASVVRQTKKCAQIVTEARGTDVGEEPGANWLKKRYHVSFKQSEVFQSGAFVDTMEVVSTWDRLAGMHDAVRAAVTPHALVLAHFSHAYREGCSIYFTFVANRGKEEESLALYDVIWEAAAKAVHDSGGSLSHHHGIGLSKMKWMVEEHGDAVALWFALKRTLDPHGVMNPGKLFPEEV